MGNLHLSVLPPAPPNTQQVTLPPPSEQARPFHVQGLWEEELENYSGLWQDFRFFCFFPVKAQ